MTSFPPAPHTHPCVFRGSIDTYKEIWGGGRARLGHFDIISAQFSKSKMQYLCVFQGRPRATMMYLFSIMSILTD